MKTRFLPTNRTLVLKILPRDTKPVTGGAFCYPPNLPMFVLAKGRLWGLFDRIELCSIAERTSYMHAGEIILRGGDIGHRRYWTTWLRRERRGNLTLNYPEGLAKCRGHCSNILYINMLAIEHEEYSIVISETFGQADGKLN
ncbi:UPF0729 protein [Trichinella pseudospiralis]